jgi:hypothetical protein
VTSTPGTLIQKLDGNVAILLVESFSSRFAQPAGTARTNRRMAPMVALGGAADGRLVGSSRYGAETLCGLWLA